MAAKRQWVVIAALLLLTAVSWTVSAQDDEEETGNDVTEDYLLTTPLQAEAIDTVPDDTIPSLLTITLVPVATAILDDPPTAVSPPTSQSDTDSTEEGNLLTGDYSLIIPQESTTEETPE